MSKTILLLIPVFNEAPRWNEDYFISISTALSENVDILFLNDGSTDTSLEKIQVLCNKSEAFKFLSSARNAGKAETIRKGIIYGITHGYNLVGFMDADGAFEAGDVVRIMNVSAERILDSRKYQAIWSSRIKLAGRTIKRSGTRHFIGRLISNLIGVFSGNRPWDTQSGLKVFHLDDKFVQIVQTEFKTRWFFEVEIMQRYSQKFGIEFKVWEEPLDYWSDIRGSKINLGQYPRIFCEILFVFYGNCANLFRNRGDQ